MPFPPPQAPSTGWLGAAPHLGRRTSTNARFPMEVEYHSPLSEFISALPSAAYCTLSARLE